MTLTYNPFADLISKAQTREADEAAKRSALRELAAKAAADRAAAKQAAAQARAEQEAAETAQRTLDGFVGRYLEAATKLVRPTWSSEYIAAIGAYANAIILEQDELYTPDLPKIDPRHAAALLEKFEYGLELAARHGRPIPEGSLYGHYLLAEKRAANPAKQPALDIKPGVVPSGRPEGSPVVAKTDADLKPATTDRKRGRDRRPGHSKVKAKAKV